jgi:hypothetical protein
LSYANVIFIHLLPQHLRCIKTALVRFFIIHGRKVQIKITQVHQLCDAVSHFFCFLSTKKVYMDQAEPLTGKAEPLTDKAEPLTGKAEPLTGKAEPLTVKAEPLTDKAEPLTVKAEPLTVKAELLTVKAEPLTETLTA